MISTTRSWILSLAISTIACACGDNLGGGPDGSVPVDAAVTPDAPSPDAPSPDAPAADRTACDDDFAGATLCDGFEDPGLAPWFQNVTDGTLIASTSPRYRGDASLRAQMDAVSATASAERTLDTPITAGTFYVRGYYYLPTGAFAYLQILKFLENGGTFGGVNVAVTADATPNLGALAETAVGTAPFPLDQWFCLQLEVVIDATLGSATLSVDGTAVATLTDVPTLPATGSFSILGVGVEFADGAQATTNVFVDEVVLDVAPIACDSP